MRESAQGGAALQVAKKALGAKEAQEAKGE